MSLHLCHAFECKTAVPPRMLMCLRHWKMVPKNIQSAVWAEYRPGQELDKMPSEDYVLVQRSAVWAVFVAEGKCTWPEVPEVGSRAFLIGPAVLHSTRTKG